MGITIKFKPRTSRSAEAIIAKKRQVREAVERTSERVEKDYKDGVHVDTGELRDSIHTEVKDDLTNSVGSSVGHARPHELGTKHIPANPALRRAIEKNRAEFKNDLRNIVRSKI